MGANKLSPWSVLSLGSLFLLQISTASAYSQSDLPSDRFAEHDASDDIASLVGGQTPIGSLNQEDYTCNQDNDAIYTVLVITF